MADLNIVITFIACFLFLQQRGKRWLNHTVRWSIAICLALAGIAGLLFSVPAEPDTPTPRYQTLIVPLVYNCIDLFFKYGSIHEQGRDYKFYFFQTEVIQGGVPSDLTRTDTTYSIASVVILIALILTAGLSYRFY